MNRLRSRHGFLPYDQLYWNRRTILASAFTNQLIKLASCFLAHDIYMCVYNTRSRFNFGVAQVLVIDLDLILTSGNNVFTIY